MPASHTRTTAFAVADVDRDGDADVALGQNGADHVLTNDGRATFTADGDALPPSEAFRTGGMAFADMNRDEFVDMVVAYSGAEQGQVYLGNGRGGFKSSLSGPVGPGFTQAVVVADVDDDGDRDVIYARGGTGKLQSALYLNRGNASLFDATSRLPAVLEDSNAVVAVDVDGDRDVDLILGSDVASGGRNRLWLNEGGRFRDVSTVSLPARPFDTTALAVGDIDGDGDADLVAGGPGSDHLYINAGGTFVDDTRARLTTDTSRTSALHLADFDGDEDLDLLVVHHGAACAVHLNDGAGRFTRVGASGLRGFADASTCAAIMDFDKDGAPDVMIGVDGAPDTLYRNTGGGTFDEISGSGSLGLSDPALVVGDVDRDGVPDLVMPNRGVLLLGNGRGGYVARRFAPEPLAPLVRRGTLVDVDGDGDDDLVLAESGRNRLFSNQGAGRLVDVTTTRMPRAMHDSFAVAVLDADGDRSPDLFFGNAEDPEALYLNDGNGTFRDASSTHLAVGSHLTKAAAAGDVDNDGDPDLVVGGFGAFSVPTLILINDGVGKFSSSVALTRAQTRDLALADIEGDGDLDLAAANAPGVFPPSGRNGLFENLGKGRFEARPTLATSEESRRVTFVDLNGDRFLDLVFAGSASEVAINDGKNGFTDATETVLPSGASLADVLSFVDIDGDGDLDLLAGGASGLALWFSFERHAVSEGAPRLGGIYRVFFYAHAGNAPPGQVLLPYVSPLPPRKAVVRPPLGNWYLEAAFLSSLAPMAIPSPRGTVVLECPIPNDASFLGLSLSTQGLIAHELASPATWRLCNVWTDRATR